MFDKWRHMWRPYLPAIFAGAAALIVVVVLSLVFLGNTTFVQRGVGLLDKAFPYIHWGSLSISAPAGPGIDYTNPGHSYGIAAGSNMVALGNDELKSRIDDMASMGVEWVRVDVEWSNIQPDNSTQYRWEDYDRVVGALRAKKLRVVAILDYTPAWARASGCDSAQCPPQRISDFADFARQAVARYSAMGVHAWEVWNEPNNPQFWVPRADAASYATMLKELYPAIHKADPYAFVLSGGLSPQATDGSGISRVDFLQRLYDAGAKDYFDGVSDHPYTFPAPPSDHNLGAWAEMSATHTNLRGIMVANGDAAKKIWITEFGAPTGGPGPAATKGNPNMPGAWHVTDDLQAAILTQGVALYKSYDWVGPFFWYSYKDAGTSNDSNENFFGLIRADGSRKPAYDAYKQAIR